MTVGNHLERWDGFTYQIQHRLHNVPVVNLSDLDETDEHREFGFDIPYRDRRINNPSREHHGAGAGRHRGLTGGDSGNRSRVLVVPVTQRRLPVRERHRARHGHRRLACLSQGEDKRRGGLL